DLLGQVAGQEPEFFPGFNRRPDQHDAFNFFVLQRFHSACNGEPGLAGPGRTNTKVDVVAANIMDVLQLVLTPWPGLKFWRLDDDRVTGKLGDGGKSLKAGFADKKMYCVGAESIRRFGLTIDA